MPIDKEQSSQIVNDAALDVLRTAARAQLDAIFTGVNSEFRQPLRLYASNPADALLNIAANFTQNSDGTQKSILSSDDGVVSYVATTINLQTASVSGGTVQSQGVTFANPATTIGQFRRLAFVYVTATNVVNSVYSASAASVGALAAPVTLFAAIEGIPIGYIDLEATASTAFKTAGSATSVIENSVGGTSRITKSVALNSSVSSGNDLKLQTITSNVATLKKGFVRYDNLMFGLEADITFNLKTGVNALSITTPQASTAYVLYLDTTFLPSSLTTHSTAGFTYYPVSSGTTGMLVVLTTGIGSIDTSRFIPIAELKTDGSSNYTAKFDAPRKTHSSQVVVNIAPYAYEDSDHSIGTVGSAGQLATYGDLATTDFPNTTTLHIYRGNETSGTSLNDSGVSAQALAGSGTPVFNSKGFFGRENIATLNGSSQYFSAANADFAYNTSGGATSFGGWFSLGNWALNGTSLGMIQLGTTLANAVYLQFASGVVRILASGGGAVPSVSTTSLDSGWHHFAVTLSGTTCKIYIDGQLAGSATIAAVAGTNTLFLGSNTGTSEWWTGSYQDIFVHKGTVLTDSQINILYSKRFKGQQLAGGHVLGTDSFQLASLSGKVSFWNLSGLTDGSVNAKNFLASSGQGVAGGGSASFAGLGLFGAANCFKSDGTVNLSIVDASYFTLPSVINIPFYAGGWFASDSWSNGSFQFPMNMSDSGGNNLVAIRCSTATNTLQFFSGGQNYDHVHSFLPGSWHHLAIAGNGVGAAKIYIDGLHVFTFYPTVTPTGSQTLMFGNRAVIAGGSSPWSGRVSEFAFAKNFLMTDNDVQKLVSARIDLANTVGVRTQDQDWKASFISEDGLTVNELSDSFLVAKADAKAWLNFGGGSANRANIRMYDCGQGNRAIPSKKFDRSFTSSPAGTIAHGLSAMPTHFTILHNSLADGNWETIAADGLIKANDTNLIINSLINNYTVDATRQMRIIAQVGVPAIGAADVPGSLSIANSNPGPSGVPIGQVLNQVNVSYIAAPFTTVVNRAKMVDLSQDLQPRMGIERIQVQSVMQVTGESGPNGEAVFKPINDKYDQLRFGGGVINVPSIILGATVYIGNVGDFFEISFYGIGLNILAFADANTRAVRIFVDGGSGVDTNISTNAHSSVLSGRNFATNSVVNLASGLSLGFHTIRGVIQAGFSCHIYGFEILNDSSSIKVAPGTALVNGLKRTLLSTDVSAYNSGFESGTLGNRGGRVVMYMRADGTIGKSVQPVAAASATLTSANHVTANEEVIRTYFWREFGAGRPDDFSTLIGSSTARAFTLDDGTTTLLGDSVVMETTGGGPDAYRASGNGNFTTLTFVGTGLDIIKSDSATGGSDTFAVSIDGSANTTFSSTGVGAQPQVVKIVSGLPYGAHTAKFTRTSAPATYHIKHIAFIVYGPKKPSIPIGAMELSDYNVMADYVQLTSLSGVADKEKMSSGVLRKANTREMVYSGVWNMSISALDWVAGWNVNTATAASYQEMTFFGTGVEWRAFLQASQNMTFSIDGSTNLSGLSTNLVQGSTGITFTPATGLLSGTSASNAHGSLKISGLTLGIHKARVTWNSGNNYQSDCIDIITPIHVHKNNGPFVLQNTLAVGSQGINDGRVTQLSYTKGKHARYIPLAQGSTTSTTEVPMGMQAAIYLEKDELVSCAFEMAPFAAGANQNMSFRLRVDGMLLETFLWQTSINAFPMILERVVPMTKGWHLIVMHWLTSGTQLSMPNLASGASEYGNLTARIVGG